MIRLCKFLVATVIVIILSLTTANLLVLPYYTSHPMSSTTSSSTPLLADILPRLQRIQIFGSLLSDVDSAWQRLSDSSAPSIVLAPDNSALQGMRQKPWKQQSDEAVYGELAYEGEAGIQRAHSNLQKFVEGYILPVKEWKEGQKVQTLAGHQVWWESKADGRVIHPGTIQVESIDGKGGNGQVWIIKGIFQG